MRQSRDHTLSFQTLATQWRALIRMAVVFTRMILALEKTDPRRALASAQLLEAWVAAAFITVTRQAAPHGPLSNSVGEGRDEAAHLQAIIAVLACLMFIAARLKRRLLAELVGEHPLRKVERSCVIGCAPARRAGYLDSS